MLLQQLLEMKQDTPKGVTYRISFNTTANSPNEAELLDIPDRTKDEITFSGQKCAKYEKEMLDLLNTHRSGQAKTPFEVHSFKVNSIVFDVAEFISDAKDTAIQYGQRQYDRVNTYRSAIKYEPTMPFSIDFTISLSRKLSNKEIEDLAADAGSLIYGQYFNEVPFGELDVKVL